jgi:hypothetical protein
MAKNVLFLVHGMGFHESAGANNGAAGWHVEVEQALRAAWMLFPSLASRSFDKYIELAPLSYDHVFRGYVESWKDAAEQLESALGESELAKVAAVIAGADADEQSFFWANITDVLLYRYGADLYRSVHVELGKQIAERVRSVWTRGPASPTLFSMLTHSLGTAAAHGALNRLGGGRIGASGALRMGGNFGLHCYMSLANVSRLLFRGQGSIYEQTIVRPQHYVRRFINVRHVADPIAAPLCFAPLTWGPAYAELSVRHLRSANVHGYAHYLAHPRVSGALFRAFLPEVLLSQAEVNAVAGEYADVDMEDARTRHDVEQVIEQVARSLREAYTEDRGLLLGSAEWLAKLVRSLWDVQRQLGSALKALS